MFKSVWRIFLLILVPSLAFGSAPGIGDVATNLMGEVSIVSDFVNSGCVIIGAAFIFSTIVKYLEHRKSPMMVPISTVWFLLIAGIALLSLPLISYVTENGLPYQLMK